MKLTLTWLKDHLPILLALAACASVLAVPIGYLVPGILVIFLIEFLLGLWSGVVARSPAHAG